MISIADVAGTWLLHERGTDEDHQNELIERYGENSKGIVTVTPDGWLTAVVCRSDRTLLAGDPAWQSDAPEADRLAAFDSYVSYAGQCRIENGQLITNVQFALNPNWVGGEQVRDIEILPDGMLRLNVTRVWPNGKKVSVWVDWLRA
jgi:hypothetical protein